MGQTHSQDFGGWQEINSNKYIRDWTSGIQFHKYLKYSTIYIPPPLVHAVSTLTCKSKNINLINVTLNQN